MNPQVSEDLIVATILVLVITIIASFSSSCNAGGAYQTEKRCNDACDLPIKEDDSHILEFKECVDDCMRSKGFVEYYLDGWRKLGEKVD
jgi:hypothetical protein